VYVANENPYFVNNNFKTNTHFDYRSWFRPSITRKQWQENEVKNVYYDIFKADIVLSLHFNLTPTKTIDYIATVGYFWSLFTLSGNYIYLSFFPVSSPIILPSGYIQTIDPGMQWRTAKHVLRNGFNKTITPVNWAFAECLELGTYSTNPPPHITHQITTKPDALFQLFCTTLYKHAGFQ